MNIKCLQLGGVAQSLAWKKCWVSFPALKKKKTYSSWHLGLSHDLVDYAPHHSYVQSVNIFSGNIKNCDCWVSRGRLGDPCEVLARALGTGGPTLADMWSAKVDVWSKK